MRKALTLMLLLGLLAGLLILTGCSDDDDDGNPVGPGTVTVTAVSAASAPTTVDHSVWGGITATTVDISGIALAKQRLSATASTASSIDVKAAVHSSTLYLWLNWEDDSFDVWRDRFVCTDTGAEGPPVDPILFLQDEISFKEDELLVLFEMDASVWDAWYWRVLTTGGGHLAEGMMLESGGLVADSSDSNVTVAVTNAVSDIIPINMQPDSSDEDDDDYLLYTDVAVSLNRYTRGWAIDQKLAGWMVDSTLAGAARADARGSHWDIASVHEYDAVAHEYTVVLSCALNTGYDDDIVMTSGDEVTVRLGISNNFDFQISGGSTGQGFTDEFTLKLP